MTEEQRLPYRVQGRWINGTRTSLCAAPTMALQRLNAYRNARYKDVEAFGPDGPLTEAHLRRLVLENGRRLQADATLIGDDSELQAVV